MVVSLNIVNKVRLRSILQLNHRPVLSDANMNISSPLPIRLLTHNIRYATTSPFPGEELWNVRRPKLTNELRFNTMQSFSSFINLQEVLKAQLDDILTDLNRYQNNE